MKRLFALLSASLFLFGCGTPSFSSHPTLSTLSASHSSAVVIPVARFSEVDPGVYRGGQPNDEAMSLFSKNKFKTIISLQNLKFPQEHLVVLHEQAQAKSLGIQWYNIPLPVKGAPPMDMVKQLLQIAHDPNNQPIFIHCAHGRDRTGTMIAAYRIEYDGYTGQKALDEMESFGFKPTDYPDFAKFVLSFTGLASPVH